MSRKRHIDTRNLVVCETLDDFSEKIEQVDSNIEDIVGHITSISRTLYPYNVENTWGVLGFTWNPSSLEILEDVPFDEEKVEHVEASGAIIDYDNKPADWKLAHAVKKGWGQFAATTIPFTVIPKLPDGYRIKEFRNTFNLIESDYIEVQNSDWSNLVDINYLARVGQSINIDITGATLNNVNKYIIGSTGATSGGQGTNAGATVYIKGNISTAINGTLEYSAYDNVNSWTSHHTIILDDENKDLNIPVTLNTSSQFYYPNPDKTFNITEWLYFNANPVKSNIALLTASKKYLINWKYVEALYSVNGEVQISPWGAIDITPETYTKTVYKITDPVSQELTPNTITIDVTDSSGIVREDKLFGINNTWYNRDETNVTVCSYDCHLNNPIQYIGDVTSITMWNPFSVVRNDNDWPEFNQSLVDKLTKFDLGTNIYGVDQGHFMYHSYLYITNSSPYTIDCSNIRYLNLFENTSVFVNDTSSFTPIGNKLVLELVKFTNTNNLFSFTMFKGISNKGSAQDNLRYSLPSMKTVYFIKDAFQKEPRLYVPEGNIIEAAYFGNVYYTGICFYKASVPAFRIRYIDCRQYGEQYSAVWIMGIEAAIRDTVQNYVEVDDEIKADINFLKASRINITRAFSPNYDWIRNCPFICTNSGDIRIANSNFQLNDFVFIYKASIYITGYNNWADISQVLNQFVTKILPNIEPNDSDSTYTIQLSKNIYDALTEEQKSYIINTLNYTLSWTSS